MGSHAKRPDGAGKQTGLFSRVRVAIQEKQEQRQAALDADTETYGELRESLYCGGSTVSIRSGGFVRVSPLFTSMGEYERLVSIEYESSIGKKNGAGRAAGAALTGGMNLLTASEKPRHLYLTIATDKRVVNLHEEAPTAGSIDRAKRLEAAGNAVIALVDRARTGEESAPVSLRQRLEELNSLLADGLIDQGEFTRLRTHLIDGAS